MEQFALASDGTRLAYDSVGEGRPIVLVHGFASDRKQNWQNVGWYETLTGAGFCVVAMDCRGHGASDKPHDDGAYGDKMVSDIVSVMDAAKLSRADVMGYSMGGILTVGLLMTYGERISRAVVAGIGETYFAPRSHRKGIAAALRASDPATITNPTEKAFRAFASQGAVERGGPAVFGGPVVSVPDDDLIGDNPELCRRSFGYLFLKHPDHHRHILFPFQYLKQNLC